MGEVKADQWDVIEFPAILPSNKPVWPNYWKIEELEAVKASLTEQKWQAHNGNRILQVKKGCLNQKGLVASLG